MLVFTSSGRGGGLAVGFAAHPETAGVYGGEEYHAAQKQTENEEDQAEGDGGKAAGEIFDPRRFAKAARRGSGTRSIIRSAAAEP